MPDALTVLLGDRPAGRLTRSRGQLRFAYDDDYRSGPGPTPLSVSMPLETSVHGHRVVAPWIAGLLPDSEQVLSRWARRFRVGTSAFALLGTPIGEDCAGAVRFVPDDRTEAALSREGTVEWLDEHGVAGRLRDLERDASSWLGADFSGRFSLAGVQSKTALLVRDGSWGVPGGAAATSHILKPAIVGFDDHHLNEHLCLQAARRVGLFTVNSEVRAFEDKSAIVVERYDRLTRPDGALRRVHQEDLAQALSEPPERKYQSDGGPGPAAIVDLFRRILPGVDADAAVTRFLDALVLNWLICGEDAHAKNYSILLAGRQIRLAPLYDVASSLAYPQLPIQKMRLAMTFGGSYAVSRRTAAVWGSVAKELRVGEDLVRQRAVRQFDALPDAFAEAARTPAVSRLGSALPERLTAAIAARIDGLRRLL